LHTGTAYRLTCDSHSEPGALLLAVTDDTGRVVGTASLVSGETWQLTAFDDRARKATVAGALWHGIVQALRINRARWLDVADERGQAYLDAIGLCATGGSVAGLLAGQRRANPEGYRLVTQGYGLDDVDLPYPGELLTAPAVAPALAS
jgi:hypothetical protein